MINLLEQMQTLTFLVVNGKIKHTMTQFMIKENFFLWDLCHIRYSKTYRSLILLLYILWALFSFYIWEALAQACLARKCLSCSLYDFPSNCSPAQMHQQTSPFLPTLGFRCWKNLYKALQSFWEKPGPVSWGIVINSVSPISSNYYSLREVRHTHLAAPGVPSVAARCVNG